MQFINWQNWFGFRKFFFGKLNFLEILDFWEIGPKSVSNLDQLFGLNNFQFFGPPKKINLGVSSRIRERKMTVEK